MHSPASGTDFAAFARNKCRYKTGKCSNTRSSKRNGQPHQLCLYHREKANKIQRKFDRQKRHAARVIRSGSGTNIPVPSGSASSSLLLSMSSSAPSRGSGFPVLAPVMKGFASLSADDLEMYSDSDSSRVSTDSDSSVSSTLEQVWSNLPNCSLVSELSRVGAASSSSAASTTSLPSAAVCSVAYAATGVASQSPHSIEEPLSHDEIDFLYAAMLE